jgi:WD40 repeat protein
VKKLPKRQTQIKVNPWDTTEMMTLGEDSIYFYTVDADWKSMEMHVPEMAIDEFNVEQAMFTCANYLSVPGQACVGTSSGELILLANRSLSNLGASLPIGEKSAIKIIKVHNGPVTALTVTKKLIMTGGQDGMLKLFDLQCRLLFWYDQFNSGGITNILSNPFGELLYQEGIPEIIVSTEQSQIFLLSRQEGSAIPFRPSTASTGFDYHTGTPSISSRADDEKKANGPLCQTILEGIYGVISKMDVNPVQPRLAIGTTKGQLQLWDLNQKTLITSRRFYEKIKQGKKETLKPLAITSLEFSKTGKSMGIGFENGLVKFLEASSLLDIHSNNILSKIMEYQSSNVSIDHISFSQDGLWCACADSNNVTILFKKETLKMKPESAGTEATEIKKPRSRIEWVFVGRRKTHYKSIVSLLFHQSSIQGSPQRLLVVSKDRHVSEIDLEQCNTADGIKLKFVRRLEQIYQPETAIILPAQKEDYLLTFTTGSKFRLFQSETQVCKNTCLGPSFGASIHRITLLNDKKTVCFGTDNVIEFNVDAGSWKVAFGW